MQISGTTIAMIRGDTGGFAVSYKRNGVITSFEPGDRVYFTVKKNVYQTEKVSQKVITEFVDGKAFVSISPEDTKPLDFRKYVYDIQLSLVDGTIITPISDAIFEVLPEVTDE